MSAGAASLERAARLARAGRIEAALSALESAARVAPDEASFRDAQADLLSAAARPFEAREARARAARLAPTPARLLALSRDCEELGLLEEALRWADRAVRRDGGPAALERRARVRALRREHAAAEKDLDAALSAEPGDPGLLLARSQARAMAGRFAAARADARLAARSGGGARLWSLQLEALAGRPAPGTDEQARFARAYGALARGRTREAASAFDRLSRGGALADRASFYAAVARVRLDAAPRRGPGVALVGLGVDPPYSATAESIRELASCDALFCNVPGPEIAELLWTCCRKVVPVFSEDWRSIDRVIDGVLALARRGLRVGFVTRGSALLYGELGPRLAARAARQGISCRCVAALSSLDAFESRWGPASTLGAGLLGPAAPLAGRRVDPALPWTVFLSKTPPRRLRALTRSLSARLGPGAPLLVFDHTVGQRPLRARLAQATALAARLSPAAILRIAPAAQEPRGRGPLLAGTGPRPRDHATLETLIALSRARSIRALGLTKDDLAYLARFSPALRPGRTPERARPEVLLARHHPRRWPGTPSRSRSLPAVSAESAACADALLALGRRDALQSVSRSALSRASVRPERSWPLVVYDPGSPNLLLVEPVASAIAAASRPSRAPRRPRAARARRSSTRG